MTDDAASEVDAEYVDTLANAERKEAENLGFTTMRRYSSHMRGLEKYIFEHAEVGTNVHMRRMVLRPRVQPRPQAMWPRGTDWHHTEKLRMFDKMPVSIDWRYWAAHPKQCTAIFKRWLVQR